MLSRRWLVAVWGGDAYVAWDAGTQTCVRDTLIMDTAADNAQLVSALRKYAATRRGITTPGKRRGPTRV